MLLRALSAAMPCAWGCYPGNWGGVTTGRTLSASMPCSAELSPAPPATCLRAASSRAWAGVGRCGQMRADAGRCGEMRGDVGRCGEMWEDLGRYGEIWVS